MASAAIRRWIVRDFQTQLYRTCGVQSIVLIAYAKEDRTPQVAMDEWNNDLDGGVDFDTFYPNWRNTEVWDQWKKYSRKKKAYIPWAKMTKDPTAWIYEECYPPGFQWADPSKIRVNEVFHLFDHWRQQKQSRLNPIIWNPSCEIMADIERPVRRRQTQRRNSEEEEDFGPAMARVAEDDMEHQYSVSPPVSSIPSKRKHSAPGPMESEEDVPDADIPSSSSSDSNPDIPSPILSHKEPLDSGGPSTLSPQIGQRTAEHNAMHEDRLQNPPSVDVPKGNAPYVRRSTRDIKLTQKARLRNLRCYKQANSYFACLHRKSKWRKSKASQLKENDEEEEESSVDKLDDDTDAILHSVEEDTDHQHNTRQQLQHRPRLQSSPSSSSDHDVATGSTVKTPPVTSLAGNEDTHTASEINERDEQMADVSQTQATVASLAEDDDMQIALETNK
ncbi:hypothetical protein EI94DRAFT_1704054 [Lactarius quietus]|nr:hypothetical protein EI94DRAFT_1704054 [Lactarius quietus]